MQPITKSSDSNHFKEWVKDNQTSINNGTKNFADIPQKTKESLQNALLVEQKYICCFCGRCIEKQEGWIEIAHFKPQEISKEEQKFAEIFDYDNLFASCNGGTGYLKYQITEKTLAKELIDKFGENIYFHLEDKYLSVEKTEISNYYHLYYHLNNGKREKYNRPSGIIDYDVITKYLTNKKKENLLDITFYKKEVITRLVQPSEILQEGNYVFVGKPYGNDEHHHCNNKQKNQELHFSFFDTDLSSYFFYNNEGEICVKNEKNIDLKTDIETILNLNSIYLTEKRKKIVSVVNDIFQEELLDTEEDRFYFYEKYSSVERLPEFAFVYVSELNRLIS